MPRTRIVVALLAAALAIANLPLHGPISDLCDAMVRRVGFEAFNRGALFGLAGLGALGVAAWWRRTRPSRDRALRALALAAISVAAWRWLVVANVELVHWPQFALLAGLVLAAGAGPLAAWGIAAAAGVVDETWQHLTLYAGRSDTYLDLNDMLFDALGAGWALVLAAPRPDWRRARAIAAALAIAGGIALIADPPALEPLLQPAVTGKPYRRLVAGEALLAAAGLLTLLSWPPRRWLRAPR